MFTFKENRKYKKRVSIFRIKMQLPLEARRTGGEGKKHIASAKLGGVEGTV
jgi:hypothetical protein